MEDLQIAAIRTKLTTATRSFRQVPRNSTALRFSTYETLRSKYLEDTDPATKKYSHEKAKIVQQTIGSETCRSVFRQIWRVIKPQQRSVLSKIEVPLRQDSLVTESDDNLHEILHTTPDEELRWDTVIDKADIERHLLTYNRKAFRAASASPCGHGVIYNSIIFSSLSTQAANLSKGSVPTSWYGDDLLLKEFLASFAIPKHVEEAGYIDTDITEDEVKWGFTKWTESTTTSPSGRHLGHYKALVQDPMLLRLPHSFSEHSAD
jgi:hypothetical protein